jgi:hypothetical protein
MAWLSLVVVLLVGAWVFRNPNSANSPRQPGDHHMIRALLLAIWLGLTYLDAAGLVLMLAVGVAA